MELQCLLAIALLAGTVEVVSGDVLQFLRSAARQSGTEEPSASPSFQAHEPSSTSESATNPNYYNVSSASSLPITPIPNPSDLWADGEVYLLSVDNICDLLAISKCLATSNQVCTNQGQPTASEPPPNPAIAAQRESTTSESTLHPTSTNFGQPTASEPPPNPAIAAQRESTTSESTLHPSSTNFGRPTTSEPPPNPAIAAQRESTTSDSTLHPYSTNYGRPTKSEPASNPAIIADRESKTSGSILDPTTPAPASYSAVKAPRRPASHALRPSYEYILL